MGLSAGRLDRTIVILTLTESVTANREVVKSWSTLSTVPAMYKPLNSMERFGANAVRSERACKFHIRYRDDVTGKMRVQYGAEIYRIIAINELGRREGLELICEAVQ